MGTRKVQQLGPSTLAITLPVEWTREHGVEKGDEITVHPAQGALTVTPEGAPGDAGKATIQVDRLDAEAVERAILSFYVLGRRKIEVEHSGRSLPSEMIDAVYEAETKVMGLGVIEETPQRVSVRCSVDPSDFTLVSLLQRLESTGRTMREEAVQALARDNDELAQRARKRERQANKLFLLLLRLVYTTHRSPPLLADVGLDDTLPLVGYRSVAKNLELTADNAEDIANAVLDSEAASLGLGPEAKRGIQDVTEQLGEGTELAVQAVVERDYEAATRVREIFHDVRERQAELGAGLPGSPDAQLSAVREVLVSLQETAQHAVRNAEIASNLALRGESTFETTGDK